eukprot:gb/GEZN01002663.1/.p1 GENE.gb/GEZN01002663.1/~~gb/GEZN01002663.1/.p1  ORF type:complete len:660 (+),score=105.07 gb/GEZN01002663.1/:48-2027(+)
MSEVSSAPASGNTIPESLWKVHVEGKHLITASEEEDKALKYPSKGANLLFEDVVNAIAPMLRVGIAYSKKDVPGASFFVPNESDIKRWCRTNFNTADQRFWEASEGNESRARQMEAERIKRVMLRCKRIADKCGDPPRNPHEIFVSMDDEPYNVLLDYKSVLPVLVEVSKLKKEDYEKWMPSAASSGTGSHGAGKLPSTVTRKSAVRMLDILNRLLEIVEFFLAAVDQQKDLRLGSTMPPHSSGSGGVPGGNGKTSISDQSKILSDCLKEMAVDKIVFTGKYGDAPQQVAGVHRTLNLTRSLISSKGVDMTRENMGKIFGVLTKDVVDLSRARSEYDKENLEQEMKKDHKFRPLIEVCKDYDTEKWMLAILFCMMKYGGYPTLVDKDAMETAITQSIRKLPNSKQAFEKEVQNIYRDNKYVSSTVAITRYLINTVDQLLTDTEKFGGNLKSLWRTAFPDSETLFGKTPSEDWHDNYKSWAEARELDLVSVFLSTFKVFPNVPLKAEGEANIIKKKQPREPIYEPCLHHFRKALRDNARPPCSWGQKCNRSHNTGDKQMLDIYWQMEPGDKQLPPVFTKNPPAQKGGGYGRGQPRMPAPGQQPNQQWQQGGQQRGAGQQQLQQQQPQQKKQKKKEKEKKETTLKKKQKKKRKKTTTTTTK